MTATGDTKSTVTRVSAVRGENDVAYLSRSSAGRSLLANPMLAQRGISVAALSRKVQEQVKAAVFADDDRADINEQSRIRFRRHTAEEFQEFQAKVGDQYRPIDFSEYQSQQSLTIGKGNSRQKIELSGVKIGEALQILDLLSPEDVRDVQRIEALPLGDEVDFDDLSLVDNPSDPANPDGKKTLFVRVQTKSLNYLSSTKVSRGASKFQVHQAARAEIPFREISFDRPEGGAEKITVGFDPAISGYGVDPEDMHKFVKEQLIDKEIFTGAADLK